MYVGDTIVAPATAPGKGAVAIVRISGPSSLDILGSIWKSPNKATLVPRKLSLGTIVDPQTGAELDRAMAVVFPKPRSQTGEDVVELQCHGGSYLVRRITGLVMSLGARMAEPGEFTRRAFLNGRIDLTEAEAIAELVDARSENALKQALSHLTGVLAHKLTGIRRELISIRAHLEAEIDFSDENIELPSRGEIASSIEALVRDVAVLHDSYKRGRLRRDGVRVVIIGKPNVGKSSIMNLLLGTDRAIVTATPGTTRDVIEDSIQIGPYEIVLQDTAGIRESMDAIERIGIERSRRSLEDADLVLAVFDSSESLTAEDVKIADHARGRIGLVILNKNDLSQSIRAGDLKALGISVPIISFSTLRPEGIEPLKRELIGAIESLEGPGSGEELAISRERHRDALARALAALDAARLSALHSMPPEIIAVDVTLAADALGEITGEIHTEDILDAVFREFCIGK